MKSRLVSLFVGLLMAAAAVFGALLAPEGAQAASVKRVTFASAGFHESNRAWTVSRPDHLQFEPFWETLMGLDPKTSDPVPALATKWEHSPDYKEWTFHLRKGVEWQVHTLLSGDSHDSARSGMALPVWGSKVVSPL